MGNRRENSTESSRLTSVQAAVWSELMGGIEARRSEGKIKGIGTAYPEISVCTPGYGAPRTDIVVPRRGDFLCLLNSLRGAMRDGSRWGTQRRES